jgi:hypothetical protein
MASKPSALYKKNVKVLSQHHPHVLDVLETPPPFPISVRKAPSGSPNLYFKDRQGGEQPLYPETNPVAGLQKGLSQVKEVRGRIVCQYGFGLGFHAIEIIQALASGNIVVLFEAHPAVFNAALTHVDLEHLLSHPNVRLVVGKAVDFFRFLSGDPEELFASLPCIAIRFDRAVGLAPSWYQKVSKDMATYNNYQIETQATLAKAGPHLLKNRFRNLLAMSRAVPMAETAGKLTGMPAVLVAAGPSLSKNIDHLKALKGKALLVAVDSAVGPLSEKGILPDLVASVDYRPLTYEKLGPFRDFLKNAGLIFSDVASFEVANYLPFKTRFFTFSGMMYRDFFNRVLQTNITEPIEHAQSVLHLAMHFVLEAGCDPIIFTGLDLAFDQGRDHAEGTVLHWGNRQKADNNRPMVTDIHGRMVPTNLGFLNMLTTCENRIQESPDRIWIDATEGGAKISGTEVMTLEAAMNRFCADPVDISGIFDLPVPTMSSGRVSETLKVLRGEIRGCLDNIDTFFECVSKVDHFLLKHKMPEKGVAGLPENIRELLGRIERLSSDPKETALRQILVDFITGPRLDIVREHRAKELEARSSGSRATAFICAYEQLKASQRIWREGFHHILNLLDFEFEVFEHIERLEEKNAGTDDGYLALAASCFKYDHLWLAQECLDKTSPHSASSDFYSGAIRLKQGEVAAGLERMREAVRKDAALSEELQRVVARVEAKWLSEDGLETFRAILRKRLIGMGPSKNVLKTLWPKNVSTVDKILSKAPVSFEGLTKVADILSDWEPVAEKFPEWWALKARWLSAQGLSAEGLSAVEKALRMSVEKKPQWLALSARLMIEIGRTDEGLKILQQAVTMDPDTAVLWEEIGDALSSGRDFDSALTAYENCLAALPDRLETFKKIAVCYDAAGHPEAARTAREAFETKRKNKE